MAISEKLNQMSGRIAGTGSIEEALAVLAMNGGGGSGGSTPDYVPEFTFVLPGPPNFNADPVITCNLTIEELYAGIVDGSIRRASCLMVMGDTPVGQMYTTNFSNTTELDTGAITVSFNFEQPTAGQPLTAAIVGGSYLEDEYNYFWTVPIIQTDSLVPLPPDTSPDVPDAPDTPE